jgi:hypothetical protein
MLKKAEKKFFLITIYQFSLALSPYYPMAFPSVFSVTPNTYY